MDTKQDLYISIVDLTQYTLYTKQPVGFKLKTYCDNVLAGIKTYENKVVELLKVLSNASNLNKGCMASASINAITGVVDITIAVTGTTYTLFSFTNNSYSVKIRKSGVLTEMLTSVSPNDIPSEPKAKTAKFLEQISNIDESYIYTTDAKDVLLTSNQIRYITNIAKHYYTTGKPLTREDFLESGMSRSSTHVTIINTFEKLNIVVVEREQRVKDSIIKRVTPTSVLYALANLFENIPHTFVSETRARLAHAVFNKVHHCSIRRFRCALSDLPMSILEDHIMLTQGGDEGYFKLVQYKKSKHDAIEVQLTDKANKYRELCIKVNNILIDGCK